MASPSSPVTEFSRPRPSDGCYDVFISFRGEDTRFGFTDNLYHLLLKNEIYTFIDVDLAGKVIESLFKIIETSRMAVVVYSEKFASSHWCLRELEMILQRWEENKMMMIPIFYKVGVNELKHPTEKTTKYFDQHIVEHGETAVQKWKDAIIKMGSVSGFPYKDIYGRSERDFITQVIAIIKKQLRERVVENSLESTSSKPHNNSGFATEHHDVFISFMGKDTRYGLVNHLNKVLRKMRKDIKIFMHDDRDLSKADNIVFEVIQRSKISVVVFSENYASSKRCLRDLVKILQCSKSNIMGQEVLPIFYEVNPSDLTNQSAKSSRIAYHLEKHEGDEESDTIQSWRDAITDLGYMVGWRYSITHSKTELVDFVEELVEDISTILTRLDEKKESTMNQQTRVSAKEENTQALAVQKNVLSKHFQEQLHITENKDGHELVAKPNFIPSKLPPSSNAQMPVRMDGFTERQAGLGGAHKPRPSEEPPEQVKFRNPVSSMDDPDAEAHWTEPESSATWTPGNDDPNSSYSIYLQPVLKEPSYSFSSPYMQLVLEEPSSSFSEGPDDDPLPALDGLQITGDAIPGRELQVSGYSINGTTSCNFEWLRHIADGSVKYIEGANMPTYLVTADDVDNYLAIEVQPLDNRKRKGELVKVFANDNKKISLEPGMQASLESAHYSGSASFRVEILTGYLDPWEPAILTVKREGYNIKSNNPNGFSVAEEFSRDTVVVINPYGYPMEFSISDPNYWKNKVLRSESGPEDLTNCRDTIVLILRSFIFRAGQKPAKGKWKKGLCY